MYQIAIVCIVFFLLVELTWVFYLATMNLEIVAKSGKMTRTAKLLSMLPRFLAALLNGCLNITLATLMFFDLPREMYFSHRLRRYCTNPKYIGTWRHKMALFFARQLLNPHDLHGEPHITSSTEEPASVA